MDLSLLATLKDKLIHTNNFSEVLDYFLTHFGMDRDFIAEGEKTESPFLEMIVQEVGKQLFQKPVRVHGLLLSRLPEHQFIHGGGQLNGKMITLLYFEDVQVGLLAVLWSARPSETKMARFSGRTLSGSHKPSAN